MLLLLLLPHRRHPRPPDRTTLPAPVPLHLLHSPRRRAPERPSHDLPPRRPPGRRESLPQGGTTMASPVPLRLLRLLLRRHPRAPLTRPPPAPPPGLQTRGDPCRSRRSFPRISPRRKPPNSRSPRPRDRKLRKFRRSKPLRILSLIQPYLPHFAHVAEEKNLYSSYAYRTHNLSIKTDMVFLDEAHFSRTPQDTLSLFSHSHFHNEVLENPF